MKCLRCGEETDSKDQFGKPRCAMCFSVEWGYHELKKMKQ